MATTELDGAAWRRRFKWGISLAFVLGVMFLGIAKSVSDYSNSQEFCISCHEMRDNNFAEYKETIHARNRTGVKATCADCHVPHEFGPWLMRKVRAAGDVFHHLAGTIETKEQFEARRLELAQRVWLYMKESDSRECRHCHDVQAMDAMRQGRTAQKQHLKLAAGEKTCIDCHYGIAHHDPTGDHTPADLSQH